MSDESKITSSKVIGRRRRIGIFPPRFIYEVAYETIPEEKEKDKALPRRCFSVEVSWAEYSGASIGKKAFLEIDE